MGVDTRQFIRYALTGGKNMLNIRAATKADLDSLRAVGCETYQAHFSTLWSPSNRISHGIRSAAHLTGPLVIRGLSPQTTRVHPWASPRSTGQRRHRSPVNWVQSCKKSTFSNLPRGLAMAGNFCSLSAIRRCSALNTCCGWMCLRAIQMPSDFTQGLGFDGSVKSPSARIWQK